MMQTLLSVNQLAIVDQQQHYLLEPLSFQLHGGELLGIIGASGSGKSMLAQGLFGKAPNDFRLQGQVHTQARLALAAQSRLVFDPCWRIDSQLQRRQQGILKQHWSRFLAQLGIDSVIRQAFPAQLSGGMGKKALLAQALVQQPQILIADEPCSGLDPQARVQMYQHLRQLTGQQHGMIVISHNLRDLLQVADRLLVLEQGRLMDSLTVAQLLQGQCSVYSQRLLQALPENWSMENVCSHCSTEK